MKFFREQIIVPIEEFYGIKSQNIIFKSFGGESL